MKNSLTRFFISRTSRVSLVAILVMALFPQSFAHADAGVGFSRIFDGFFGTDANQAASVFFSKARAARSAFTINSAAQQQSLIC
jgi:hypothetical protein